MTTSTTSSNDATITATSLSGSKSGNGSFVGMQFMAPTHTGATFDHIVDHKDWLSHHSHPDNGSAPNCTGAHDWTPPIAAGSPDTGVSTGAIAGGHTWTDHHASTPGGTIASPQS